MASIPVNTRPIRGVSIVGGISVDCRWNISRPSSGGIPVNYRIIKFVFLSQNGEAGFQCHVPDIAVGALKIVSVLLFVSIQVSLTTSTCYQLLLFKSNYDLQFSM